MKRRRGIALVSVLLVLAVLAGIGTTIAAARRTTVALAMNARAEVSARYAAESGIVQARNAIQLTLARTIDSSARERYLNALGDAQPAPIELGEARFQVVALDPSTRLDVNAAPDDRLQLLFSKLASLPQANATARAIAAYRQRRQVSGTPFVEPIRSLEELSRIPGVDQALLSRAAPMLTVDGEASVNVATASPTVRAVAFGEQRMAPTRLVLISRGWTEGHPLSIEIQAAYAISNNELALLHWRERRR